MKSQILAIALILFLCPVSHAYRLNFSPPDQVRYLEKKLFYGAPDDANEEGYWMESRDANEGGDGWSIVSVVPEAGDTKDVIAKVVVTTFINEWLEIDYQNFENINISFISPVVDAYSVTEIIKLKIYNDDEKDITLPETRFIYDTYGPYFNDYPVPIDASLDAFANVTAWWEYGGTASVVSITPLPEPSTILLIGMGMIGIVGHRLRKR
jgi:hypothetical protein